MKGRMREMTAKNKARSEALFYYKQRKEKTLKMHSTRLERRNLEIIFGFRPPPSRSIDLNFIPVSIPCALHLVFVCAAAI